MIRDSISISTSGRRAARRPGTSGRCSILPRPGSASPCPGPGRCGRPRSSPGLAGGGTGLLIIMDHVLADGIAGLAVLGMLVNQVAGTAGARTGRFPAPAPRARELAADAWRSRLHRVARGEPGALREARGMRRIREGIAELGGARPPRSRPRPHRSTSRSGRGGGSTSSPSTSPPIRDLGHAHGGTVNDVVLAAVAGALRTLLAARGEQLGEVTITVPVAARRAATGGELGNHIGIMPVTVPATGDFGTRVTRTAAITRERKSGARGASATLFVPAFLLLARTGLLRWSPATNGSSRLSSPTCAGRTTCSRSAAPWCGRSSPSRPPPGNVTVTFAAAASYAGTLRVTILSDPARDPRRPRTSRRPLPRTVRPADRPSAVNSPPGTQCRCLSAANYRFAGGQRRA